MSRRTLKSWAFNSMLLDFGTESLMTDRQARTFVKSKLHTGKTAFYIYINIK